MYLMLQGNGAVETDYRRDSVGWWRAAVGIPLTPWQEEILMQYDERHDTALPARIRFGITRIDVPWKRDGR